MSEPEIPKVTPLTIPMDLQARAVAIPIAYETPISAQLFTINESKSWNSPCYSELGASMSVGDSTLSPKMIIKRPNNFVLTDEEKGDYDSQQEVGDIRCLWVPSGVNDFGDFITRIWSWLLLNKEQAFSALTVTCTLIPEVMTNSIIAGVPPSFGLQGVWIMNVINALLGGKPGMIFGASTYVSVSLITLVRKQGQDYIFYALLLSGLMQLIFGLFRLGTVFRLIPIPAVRGFSSAISFITIINQVRLARNLPNQAFSRLGFSWQNLLDGDNHGSWYPSSELLFIGVETAISFGIMLLLHIFVKQRKVPSALIAILICVAIEHALLRSLTTYKTPTLSSLGQVRTPFLRDIWTQQNVSLPPLNLDTLRKIYITSLAVFGSSLMENALTQRYLDESTHSHGNVSCTILSNGIASVVATIFGGLSGSGSVSQSLVLLQGHGVSRLSTFLTGVFTMVSIYFAYDAINYIPIGAVAGVMIWTAICLFEWQLFITVPLALIPRSIRERFLIDRKIPRMDVLVLLVVLGVAISFDLAVAVMAGVILSITAFAWDNSNRIYIERENVDGYDHGKVIYYMSGPLFFGSAQKFLSLFPYKSPEKEVVIDLERCEVHDLSGMVALKAFYDAFVREGKITAIASLSSRTRSIMEKNAFMWEGINFLVLEDSLPDDKDSIISDY